MKPLSSVIVALAASLPIASAACSCIKEELFIARDAWAIEVLRNTGLVVHGTVDSLLPENGAVVSVRKVLKGTAGGTLTVHAFAPPDPCGTKFTVGETYVYFVRSEPLSLCSKLPASESLLLAIPELLASPR
jgi:hypothetical protein